MDQEDLSNYRSYLRWIGLSTYKSVELADKMERREKRRTKLLQKAYRNRPEYPKYKSPLEMILFPQNEKLASLPYYDRYIAWLLTEYESADAAKILGMNRMTIWRFLDANGYATSYSRRGASRALQLS